MDKINLEYVINDLRILPKHIREKFFSWTRSVERYGLNEVRKIPGYHDEKLKGKRSGQRSVRLSRGYRAIYREEQDGQVNVIQVLEVNKHDY